MPPTFTLTAEFTREGLLELRRQLDELLLQAPPADAERSVGETAVAEKRELEGLAEDKVSAIRGHLGEASWNFLRACAEEFEDHAEFSLEHIAHAMGLEDDVGKVKAYHRNVTRSEKKVNGYLAAGVPPLLRPRWDGERNQYTMPSEVRRAILVEVEGDAA